MTPYRVLSFMLDAWPEIHPSPGTHPCSLDSGSPKRLSLTGGGAEVPFLDRWPSSVLPSYWVMHSCMPSPSGQSPWMGRRSWLEVTSSSFPSVVFFSLSDSSAGKHPLPAQEWDLVLGLSSKEATSKGTRGLECSSGTENLPGVLEPWVPFPTSQNTNNKIQGCPSLP